MKCNQQLIYSIMEKKINKKIAEYIFTFKNDIKEKAELIGNANTEENLQLLQYIYDYERLTITKDDISKRKRVKSHAIFFKGINI